MKMSVFAALVFSAFLASSVAGQVKSVAAANNTSARSAAEQSSNNTTRARVLGQESRSNPGLKTLPGAEAAKLDFNHSEASRVRRTTDVASGHTALKPASSATAGVLVPIAATTIAAPAAPVASSSTQVYRVGIGDVLDIQLAGNNGRNSTLFTVLENGVLEYPLAGNPIIVSGMTTTEVANLLRQRIKIFDNPNVSVSVRDYASHSVSISGFVAAGGTKILRREAVPLYALLAEASVLPEAARATITRAGRAPMTVDLKDTNLSGTLVLPGDVIKVSGLPPAPTEFYFVGGEINSPGQKPFHVGLTLTQALLASGGTKASAGAKVRVSRQGTDGRLSSAEFNLKKIQSGKEPDPVLQKGDRIEVTNAN